MTQRLTPRYMHIAGAALVALDQGTADQPDTLEHVQKKLTVVNYVWNPVSLAYEVMVQPSTGSGAGSSSVDASLTSLGSTRLVGKVELSPTTPGSSNDYLWVRTVGASGAGSTVVDVNSISSSTSHVGDVSISSGTVTVGNPTTSVSLSSQITASVTGTTSVNVANQPTVDLSSVGSTKLVGQVTVANPTTAVTVSSGVILAGGSSANVVGSVALVSGSTAAVIGAVAVSSGLVLGAGSSANTIGSVALVAGTSANILGSVVLNSGTTAITLGNVALAAGTSANTVGSVALVAGTSGNTVGSVALVGGSSANTLGNVAQGPGGSSANNWITDGFAFSSANTSRTSVSTTVDAAVVASNANRKALVIANLSTSQVVALGMSTGAVTTALGNVSLFLQPASQVTFGIPGAGGFPNFTGNIRGINITSTTVAGGVAVTQFTNT